MYVWGSLIAGVWQYKNYTYSACSTCGDSEEPAVMSSPTPGSALSSPTVFDYEQMFVQRSRLCAQNTCLRFESTPTLALLLGLPLSKGRLLAYNVRIMFSSRPLRKQTFKRPCYG